MLVYVVHHMIGNVFEGEEILNLDKPACGVQLDKGLGTAEPKPSICPGALSLSKTGHLSICVLAISATMRQLFRVSLANGPFNKPLVAISVNKVGSTQSPGSPGMPLNYSCSLYNLFPYGGDNHQCRSKYCTRRSGRTSCTWVSCLLDTIGTSQGSGRIPRNGLYPCKDRNGHTIRQVVRACQDALPTCKRDRHACHRTSGICGFRSTCCIPREAY